MKSVLRIALIASVLAILSMSCAHVPLTASAHRFDGVPVLPATDPSLVALLEQPPASRYVALGEVKIVIKDSLTESEARRDAQIQAAIREQAASLGATAVINFIYRPRLSTVRHPVEFTNAVAEVRATAIRNAS